MDELSASDGAPGQSGEGSDSSAVRTKRLRHHLIEWGLLVVLALVVAVVLRDYVFQTFVIPSGSMEPTLEIGDRIVVDKLVVDWGSIHRGDIVVFHSPPNENCGGARDAILVKRVVGLPGDELYSVGNTIFVDGKKLNETWTHTEPLGPPAVASKAHPVVVAANNYLNGVWGGMPLALAAHRKSTGCDCREQ